MKLTLTQIVTISDTVKLHIICVKAGDAKENIKLNSVNFIK